MTYRLPPPSSRQRRPPPKPQKPWWVTIGIVLATVVGILGLVFVGLVILAFVLIGMSGSNK
jgi:hypothetical protein